MLDVRSSAFDVQEKQMIDLIAARFPSALSVPDDRRAFQIRAIDLNRSSADLIFLVAKQSVASRLTLLGRSEMKLPASPAEARLETFPNPARRNLPDSFRNG